MTYMLLLNCALKLVEEIIIYYDARSKKHQIKILISYLTEKITCQKSKQVVLFKETLGVSYVGHT